MDSIVAPANEPIRRMTAAEFRACGYLQELNRRFLHPLGLALEVQIHEDGTESFGGVWDYREEPEGMVFADTDLSEHALKVDTEWELKRTAREAALGFMIQPGIDS